MDRGRGEREVKLCQKSLTDMHKESYLLRTRNNKMPYKHIAAHLNKTELACRLHYHQMSFGNSRRKRADSSSSVGSTKRRLTGLPPYDTLLERTPNESVPSGRSPCSSPRAEAYSPEWSTIDSSHLGKDQYHLIDSAKLREDESRGLLPAPTDIGRTLRLDTAFVMPTNIRRHKYHDIDLTRLHSIYRANRHAFWANIASQYSTEQYVSPLQLEQAFFSEYKQSSAHGTFPLPTPNATPKVSPDPSYSAPVLTAIENYGFNAINRTPVVNTAISAPSPGRCAVSALLNEPLSVT